MSSHVMHPVCLAGARVQTINESIETSGDNQPILNRDVRVQPADFIKMPNRA